MIWCLGIFPRHLVHSSDSFFATAFSTTSLFFSSGVGRWVAPNPMFRWSRFKTPLSCCFFESASRHPSSEKPSSGLLPVATCTYHPCLIGKSEALGWDDDVPLTHSRSGASTLLPASPSRHAWSLHPGALTGQVEDAETTASMSSTLSMPSRVSGRARHALDLVGRRQCYSSSDRRGVQDSVFAR